MTNHEIEEEISRLLNAAPREKRKDVQNNMVYKLCVQAGDMEKALERVYAIINGEAPTITQMRRLLKRQRRKENDLKFI